MTLTRLILGCIFLVSQKTKKPKRNKKVFITKITDKNTFLNTQKKLLKTSKEKNAVDNLVKNMKR